MFEWIDATRALSPIRGERVGIDRKGRLNLPLDRERDAHAAADAQRGEALAAAATGQFVQQRRQDARARGADRMADGDRAALSQVTTLLNRAVTLATEGETSGVTTAQASALNNEFGSILSEINQTASTTNFNGQNVFASNSPAVFTSSQGTSTDKLTTGTDLTAGSVTTITDAQTGGTMVFTAQSGNTIGTLQTAINNAVSAGTLSAGTSAQINANGQLQHRGPNTGDSGLTVSTNDAVLGTMSATPQEVPLTSAQSNLVGGTCYVRRHGRSADRRFHHDCLGFHNG